MGDDREDWALSSTAFVCVRHVLYVTQCSYVKLSLMNCFGWIRWQLCIISSCLFLLYNTSSVVGIWYNLGNDLLATSLSAVPWFPMYKFACHFHFKSTLAPFFFHVTIPQLFKHASLSSLPSTFSWRRPSWPKRSEQKLKLLRYHARKLAPVPIGTNLEVHAASPASD